MIRHGETKDNIAKIFSRDTTTLTNKGIGQVKRAKELLVDFKFDKVYYSPLTRTVETFQHLDLQGTEEPRIRENNFGIFTGKTFEEISAIYPEETKAWVEDTINYEIPQGESLQIVYHRVVKFLEEISKSKENILLVTHDCVIRMAFCWIFEKPEYFFRFKVDNGSINIISVDDGFKYIKKQSY